MHGLLGSLGLLESCVRGVRWQKADCRGETRGGNGVMELADNYFLITLKKNLLIFV